METSLLFHKFAPENLTVLALVFLPFVLTYLTTLLKAVITYKIGKSGGSPPTAPYWIPWIGHAWPFILSPTRLALSVRYDFNNSWQAHLSETFDFTEFQLENISSRKLFV